MTPNLDITIIPETDRWQAALPNYIPIIENVVEITLLEVGHPLNNTELSVVLADDEFLQRFNAQYRGKDHPTNVLSFPADKSVEFADNIDNLGDILISLSTLEWEATEQGKSLESHFKHMLIHGVLHLLGYDHQADDEAEKMENLEITILQSLGIENPYEQKI